MIAARIPDKMIGSVMYCSRTVLETVLAIPNSPIIYLDTIYAKKLKKAAQHTAWNGVKTRVVTIEAMEFAASWKPLI